MLTRAVTALAAAGLLLAVTPASGATVATASGTCTPSWNLVPTPNPGDASLGGPAVVSRKDVWFPADNESGRFNFHAGMLRWNGHSITDAPEPPSNASVMTKSTIAASFDSSTDGWVLGRVTGFPVGNQQDYLARWNGARWMLTPPAVSRDPETTSVSLNAVASPSPANAWAVGGFLKGQPPGQDLVGAGIEHWDGTQWTLVPNPASTQPGALLNALTVISPADIWAVGWQNNADGVPVPLAEHWNGTAWATVVTPTGAAPASFHGVNAVDGHDVWAVGGQTEPGTSNTSVPLIEHWNGTAWNVETNLPDLGNARLEGIYAGSSTDVWVTSLEPIQSGTSGAFLHWDGTTWKAVPVPQQKFGTFYRFFGIDGTGPDDVWASGEEESSSSSSTRFVIAHLSCG